MNNVLIDKKYLIDGSNPNKLITIFGNAKLDTSGHYHISSRIEGNHRKGLHRLIFEDVHNCKIPKGYEIHHQNGNPSDNRSENLVILPKSEHMKLHANNMSDLHRERISQSKLGSKNAMYGKTRSKESRELTGLSLTSTGLFHIYKRDDSDYKKGYKWCYEYQCENKSKVITRANLLDLIEVIHKKKLEWVILDKTKAKQTLEQDGVLQEYTQIYGDDFK